MPSYTLRESCGTGFNCPRIKREEETLVITGDRVDDPTIPEHEATVRLPSTMFPELFHLDIPDLGAYITERHTRDLLHVETLDRYDVASDDGDYEKFLRGEPGPTSADIAPFHDRVRYDTDAGRRWRNVHVLRTPLTPYLAYELGWLYPGNAVAGVDTRILDITEHPAGEAFLSTGDFWAIDGVQVARSRYDRDGRYLGAVAVGSDVAASFVALGEVAWRLATPFTSWWGLHHGDIKAA